MLFYTTHHQTLTYTGQLLTDEDYLRSKCYTKMHMIQIGCELILKPINYCSSGFKTGLYIYIYINIQVVWVETQFKNKCICMT